jgi:hypothetical protein
MLRNTDAVAAALGCASQTAFAAAFSRVTGENACLSSNRSSSTSIALGQLRACWVIVASTPVTTETKDGLEKPRQP